MRAYYLLFCPIYNKPITSVRSPELIIHLLFGIDIRFEDPELVYSLTLIMSPLLIEHLDIVT